MGNEKNLPTVRKVEPVQRLWPRYRPQKEFAIEPGLREVVEALDRKSRFRSAMDKIFQVLDRDPANQHALRLALLIVGRDRTTQLHASEPLTPAYLHDRRLDPIFAVCDNCGTEWAPDSILLPPFQLTTTLNPAGLQCTACDFTLCRNCQSSVHLSVDFAHISTACPHCGQATLSSKVFPTGRAPRQMARHEGRVIHAFVFREGPIAPDEPTMRAMFEDISPDVLESGAVLHGVNLFPWPENVAWHTWRYVENLAHTAKLPPETIHYKESAQVVDRDNNRILVIKLIQPQAMDIASLQALKEERPRDPQVRLNLARALLVAGYYHSVGFELDAAKALDPTLIEEEVELPTEAMQRYHQAMMGEKYAQQLIAAGKLSEAAVHLEAQVHAYPNWAVPYGDLAYCEIQRDHEAAALEILRQGLALGDPTPELYSNLALVNLLIGNEGPAIAAAQEALKINPDHPDASTNYREALQALQVRSRTTGQTSDILLNRDILQHEWPCYRASEARSACVEDGPPPPLALRWQAKVGAIIDSSPAVASGRVFVGCADGRVICVDAFTGQMYWQAETGDSVISSPAIAGERVYVGSDDGKLYCLDARTGRVRWSFTTQAAIAASPLVTAGRVLVAATNGRLHCLDTEGAELWHYDAGNDLRSSPAFYANRVYLSAPETIACLDLKSGELIWCQERGYDTGNILALTPAIGPTGIYLAGSTIQPDGSSKGQVYCYKHADGCMQWSYEWPTKEAGFQSSPALSQEEVIIFGMDGLVLALKQHSNSAERRAEACQSGVVTWYNRKLYKWWMLASPAVGGKFLYQCANDGKLYCLAVDTGEILWSQQIDAETEGASSSPALAYERLYVGTSRNGLLCFSAYPQRLKP